MIRVYSFFKYRYARPLRVRVRVVSAAIAVMVLAVSKRASADTVRTLDGKTYDGEIRFQAGQSLHVLDKQGRDAAIKLSHLLDATASGVPLPVLNRGVVMTDGTTIAGSIDAIGDKFVRVTPAGGPTIQIAIEQVARVVFQPAAPEQFTGTAAGSVGLLLKGGDFLEAKLRNYDGYSMRMESTLFGLGDFDTHDKAVALVLKPARKLEADTIVRTKAGSELPAERVTFERDRVNFSIAAIGAMGVLRRDLYQIRCGGGRLVSLIDLRPDKIEAADPATALAIDKTNVGLSTGLLGPSAEHAIATSLFSRVSYALDEQYDLFTARVGMPVDAVPMVAIRFGVLVDGKSVASETLTSIDDPASFSIDLRHAKRLTLLVETSGLSTGPPGIWADPKLLKHQSPVTKDDKGREQPEQPSNR